MTLTSLCKGNSYWKVLEPRKRQTGRWEWERDGRVPDLGESPKEIRAQIEDIPRYRLQGKQNGKGHIVCLFVSHPRITVWLTNVTVTHRDSKVWDLKRRTVSLKVLRRLKFFWTCVVRDHFTGTLYKIEENQSQNSRNYTPSLGPTWFLSGKVGFLFFLFCEKTNKQRFVTYVIGRELESEWEWKWNFKVPTQ